jgi:hypothetical protein
LAQEGDPGLGKRLECQVLKKELAPAGPFWCHEAKGAWRKNRLFRPGRGRRRENEEGRMQNGGGGKLGVPGQRGENQLFRGGLRRYLSGNLCDIRTLLSSVL